MRRPILALAVFALLSVGAFAVHAGVQRVRACSTSEKPSAVGTVAGKFDPVMSGVCRFACATKLKYDATDVIAQPGAKSGRLTQCPVSGVVFVVDEKRPHLRVADKEYVACCGNCAAKLRGDPAHYLKI